MNVLCALESVHHVHAWMPEKENEGVGSPGTGVADVVSHHGVVGIEPGSSSRTATDPTFQVLQSHLKNIVIVFFSPASRELFSDGLSENSGPLAPSRGRNSPTWSSEP